MTTAKKVWIILAVVFVLVGCGLVGTAAALVEFDFTRFNTMDFTEKSYTVTEAFTEVSIEDTEYSVYLRPSEDGTCRVECRDSRELYHEVSVENGVLTVRRVDARKWYERIGIFWNMDWRMTVYLPVQDYERLFLHTVSGEAEIPVVFLFKKAEVQTVSGELSYSGFSESLTLSSTSGGVTVSDAVTGTAAIATTSGDIRITSASGSAWSIASTSGTLCLTDTGLDTLSADTVSGDITFENTLLTGKLKATSTSGELRFSHTDAASLELETVSGNVVGELRSAKNFKVETTSGRIHTPDDDPTAGLCVIATTSGDVTLSAEQ